MLTLKEYNKMLRSEIEAERRKKIFCGVVCDDCGQELKYVDYSVTLTSYPPMKEVVCPGCGKRDYMVIKR